jgi:hypothetical protein
MSGNRHAALHAARVRLFQTDHVYLGHARFSLSDKHRLFFQALTWLRHSASYSDTCGAGLRHIAYM